MQGHCNLPIYSTFLRIMIYKTYGVICQDSQYIEIHNENKSIFLFFSRLKRRRLHAEKGQASKKLVEDMDDQIENLTSNVNYLQVSQ